MEDLIQNAHTLFDERPSPSPPVPSPHVAKTASTYTYRSLFLSPELPQLAEVHAMGSTTRHRPGLVCGIPSSTQSSFSLLSSDAAMESCLTPSPTPLRRPLPGPPSSLILTEGVETTTQQQIISKARGTKVVISPLFTSVAGSRPPQPRLHPHQEALTIPQSPPESVLSSSTDPALASASTSLQTRMGRSSSP